MLVVYEKLMPFEHVYLFYCVEVKVPDSELVGYSRGNVFNSL